MPGSDNGREDAAVRSCGYPQVRKGMPPRERLTMLLLWLFLPVLAAAVTLNMAGVITRGWMIGIVAGSWPAFLAAVLWLGRGTAGKENGDA